MDHVYIKEHNIADLYVADDLPVEQRASFEEHFFECEECLREIEMARAFRSGMKQLPVPSSARRAPGVIWLAIAAGVAIMVIPAALLYRSQRDGVQLLQSEHERNARLEQAIARLSSPNANVDVYPLNITRGGSQDGRPDGGYAARISLPASERTLVLFLDSQADRAYTGYRARLADATGSQVWSQDQIQPGARSTFAISLSSRLLHVGNYTLTFEGIRPAGDFTPLATYRLAVSQ
jgi:hypothetical protein